MRSEFANIRPWSVFLTVLLATPTWLGTSLAEDSPVPTTDVVLDAPLAIDDPLVIGDPIVASELADAVAVDEPQVEFGDWLGYNASQSHMSWLSGGDFGMFSLESFPTLKIGQESALLLGTGFHFLNGPATPDLPPRLFDFQAAYHVRKAFSPHTLLDIKLGVGAFSDFEGSARKGVRFPGHVVAYRELNREVVSVFGIEFLDRDDISLLPVAGMVWKPHKDLVLEMIFPRPKVQLQLNKNSAMYVGGELGGGTWAIERTGPFNDNVTYRDLRITCGVMHFGDSSDSVLEVGWAFDRSLEFRSHLGDQHLDGAFLLRSITHY